MDGAQHSDDKILHQDSVEEVIDQRLAGHLGISREVTLIDPDTFGTGVSAETGSPAYVVEGSRVRLVGSVKVASGSDVLTSSSPLFVLPVEIKPAIEEITAPEVGSLWFPVIGEQFPPLQPWAGACALNFFVNYPSEGFTEVYFSLLAYEPVGDVVVHLNGVHWGF